MKKLVLFTFLLFTLITNAQQDQAISTAIDSIENTLHYKTGKITLTSGNGVLTVPNGFKFLEAKEAQYVLSELWGNPKDETLLGVLVPAKLGVTSDNSWLFTVNFDPMGYVDDSDANDIKYDDLLNQMKEDVKAESTQRKQDGFDEVSLIGWASAPYYDQNKKILHWAKEIHFGSQQGNTLNYDLRILGRKGVYILSAVGSMQQLPEIKSQINSVVSSIQFEKGHTYFDFDADTDSVAAWTLGGLVAGKVLAKVGFFAIIAKFGKFILLGIIAAFAAVKKFFFGNKDHQSTKHEAKEDDSETQTEEQ